MSYCSVIADISKATFSRKCLDCLRKKDNSVSYAKSFVPHARYCPYLMKLHWKKDIDGAFQPIGIEAVQFSSFDSATVIHLSIFYPH